MGLLFALHFNDNGDYFKHQVVGVFVLLHEQHARLLLVVCGNRRLPAVNGVQT